MKSNSATSFVAEPSPILTIAQWLMVLPAAAILAAAAMRSMGGRGLAVRLADILCQWAFTHLSHVSAALLFIALPAAVVMVGGATLWRGWKSNRSLRDDVNAALTIVRQHAMTGVLATATLLAAAILLFVITHMITD